MYFDAGNNKVGDEVVLRGEISDKDVVSIETLLANFPENGFLTHKIGLPGLQGGFVNGAEFDPELDMSGKRLRLQTKRPL